MVLKTSREQWFTIAEKRYEDTNSQARQQQGSFRSTKHEQVIALEPREKKIFLTDFSKKKKYCHISTGFKEVKYYQSPLKCPQAEPNG